jgi:hypothetical protein
VDAPDLAHDPVARRARKRPVKVDVRFAAAPGVLATGEGDVRYDAGDAIVTGAAGDTWPVPRARFVATYDAVPPTPGGAAGTYRKRVAVVHARRMDAPFAVTLSDGRGTLSGAAGDWLVEYAPGDLAVVDGAIFATTYELVD